MAFLAQSFDDWAEIALIAVVVVGSFVANVIKNWTQRREKKVLDEQMDRARQARPRPATPAPAPFEFPTAKPMPPMPPRTRPATGAPPVIERRPTTQPRPVIDRRTIVIETQRGEAPRPPRVQRVPPPLAQSAGEARTEPRRKGHERPAAPAAPRQRPRPQEPAAQPPRPAASPARAGPSELTDTVTEHEYEWERLAAARIGHVHDGVVAPVVDDEVEVGVEEREIGAAKPPASRISRRALRHGIIMAEVLSPPVSCRPPEEAYAL